MQRMRAIRKLAQYATSVSLSPWRRGSVVMFHTGRCGSTVLSRMLDQHPEVMWEGEIFRPGYMKQLAELRLTSDPFTLIRLRRLRAGKAFYGFDTKFQHDPKLLNVDLPAYVARIRELGFRHMIVLRRKNHLRQIVSGLISFHLRRIHRVRNDEPRLNRIYVDLEEDNGLKEPLLDRIDRRVREYELLSELLKDDNVLYLTYEDHIEENPCVAYRLVCDFLGIAPRDAEVTLGRVNPFPLSDLVTNYDEVEAHLKDSPHAWMLDA